MSGYGKSFPRGGQTGASGGARKSCVLPVAGRTLEVLAVRKEDSTLVRFFVKRGVGLSTEIASYDLAAKRFVRTDETLEHVTELQAISDLCGFLTAIL